MPDTKPDTPRTPGRYTVELSLGKAEALQDALFDEYGRAIRRRRMSYQRLMSAAVGSPEAAEAQDDYEFAVKSAQALDELMKAVGQHV